MALCRGVQIQALTTDYEWATLIGAQKVQGGLPARTSALWREVARAFPQLTGAGAWGDRSHNARKSDHNQGYAVDFMTKDRVYGDRVLGYLLLHRDRLGLSYVIWWGHVYSEKNGWTKQKYLKLNQHKDHLHVSLKR